MPRAAGSAISPAQQDQLVTLLRAGHYINHACVIAHVHRDTFAYWCRKGGANRFAGSKGFVPPEQAKPTYRKFVRRIERAQALAEADAVEAITSAFAYDWRAAAHWLSRRYPERWGPGREKRQGGTLDKQEGGVTIWLPDNKRGDSPEAQRAQPPEDTTP